MSVARQKCGTAPEPPREIWHARPGSWVRVQGRDGVFVVLHLDEPHGLADLLLMDRVRVIENSVPLEKLLELKEIP